MISLYDLLDAADGQLFGEPSTQVFTDLALQPDQVEPGCLFVATQTLRGDGHQFMQAAVDRGALGLMCIEPPAFSSDGITVIVVRDVERALLNWARKVLERFGTTVIAACGAGEQETAVAAIAAVLGTRYPVYRGPQRGSGRLALPLALGGLEAHHRMAVLALPTGALAALPGAIQPMVAALTGGEPERGGAESVAAALVHGLPEGGLAVLNYDDPALRALADHASAQTLSIGIDSFDAELMAFNIVTGRHRTGFDVRYGLERQVGRWTPLLGRRQLMGALAGLAVGLSFDVPFADGLRALTEIEPPAGRMRPLNGAGGCLLVDDTAAATPEAARHALGWLAEVREAEGRLIYILGALDGAGRDLRIQHRRLGEQAAEAIDLIVAQGGLAMTAAQAALDAGMARRRVHMTSGPVETAALLRANLGPRDVVLVQGGRTAHMEDVVRALLHDPADTRWLAPAEADLGGWARAQRPSWLRVDLDAIGHNVRKLRALLGPDVGLMAIVAADAYGHGAFSVASTALQQGATSLGVACVDEGVALREAGLDAPIVVLGHVPPAALWDAIRSDLTLGVGSADLAGLGNTIAADLGRRLRVHVRVDCGTGRGGSAPPEVTAFFRNLKRWTSLSVEGAYTDLGVPGEAQAVLKTRLAAFQAQIQPLLATGLPLGVLHAADGAALLALPDSRLSMVRDNTLLYGLPPAGMRLPDGFRPALTWTTALVQVRAPARAARDLLPGGGQMRTAVIPVGYVDGFRARPRAWEAVLVGGRRVPVCGPVGAHESVIDISVLPEAHVGDEVVLLGQQGGE